MRIQEASISGQEILLFYADLDDLKLINDVHGHEVGDRAICEAASVLRDILRASDCLARLGGDEFCALVPVRSAADGEVILRRLEQRVGGQNTQPNRIYTVGLTAAVLPLGTDLERPLAEMIHEVDQRMYAAKRGRKVMVESASVQAQSASESAATVGS
jgi:diguanylate cyclase (GGDEF)-like protein